MVHTAFDNYANKIRRLRSQSLANGMTSEQFERVYHTALENFRKESPRSTQTNPDPPKRILFTKRRCLVFSLLLVAVVAYNIKTIHSNLQEYIYLALQLLRNLSIPIVAVFPSLTELYHETCLLHNPFFTVVDMDCWPCSSTIITNVQQIDEPIMQQMNNNQLHNAPFIYKTDQKSMDFNSLKNLYLSNYKVFDLESSKVLTNNRYHITPKEMFEEQGENNLHFWKLNSINTARILRQVIPRPKVVPKFGQSMERFIIVDQRKEAFKIPDTECNFSFLLVLAGSRTVELNPAEECKHQCKSLKIDLKENYLLWYNWWYWKPLVQQSGNETFIAHIGSYC